MRMDAEPLHGKTPKKTRKGMLRKPWVRNTASLAPSEQIPRVESKRKQARRNT